MVQYSLDSVLWVFAEIFVEKEAGDVWRALVNRRPEGALRQRILRLHATPFKSGRVIGVRASSLYNLLRWHPDENIYQPGTSTYSSSSEAPSA